MRQKGKMIMNTTLQVENWARASHSILELPRLEPWPQPVDGARLLHELHALFGRFVVLPKWSSEALALWTLHTYAFQCRDVSTYIGLESPEKRCGKTTLLTVLSELVNRPVVAANISSSVLFRVIEEMRPTLLIDEADTFLQGNDEMRGILNSGYTRKTAYVVRVANQSRPAQSPRDDGAELPGEHPGPGPASRLVRFSCWCPKIMAAIGRLPETLADRCIVIKMQRKAGGEVCERLKNLDATLLRRQCVRFASDHAETIAAARPELPPSLNDRAGDIWEPLLALAGVAGGPWPDLARQAAGHLTAGAAESSPITSLLIDIALRFIRTGGDRFFSRDLLAVLNNLPDRPWSPLRGGREVSELWLSQQLRPSCAWQVR
jgi:putative DNA primase/helicase